MSQFYTKRLYFRFKFSHCRNCSVGIYLRLFLSYWITWYKGFWENLSDNSIGQLISKRTVSAYKKRAYDLIFQNILVNRPKMFQQFWSIRCLPNFVLAPKLECSPRDVSLTTPSLTQPLIHRVILTDTNMEQISIFMDLNKGS